jgi:hypothetical protein
LVASTRRALRMRQWSTPTTRRCPLLPATRRAWSASRSPADSDGPAGRAAGGRSSSKAPASRMR